MLKSGLVDAGSVTHETISALFNLSRISYAHRLSRRWNNQKLSIDHIDFVTCLIEWVWLIRLTDNRFIIEFYSCSYAFT